MFIIIIIDFSISNILHRQTETKPGGLFSKLFMFSVFLHGRIVNQKSHKNNKKKMKDSNDLVKISRLGTMGLQRSHRKEGFLHLQLADITSSTGANLHNLEKKCMYLFNLARVGLNIGVSWGHQDRGQKSSEEISSMIESCSEDSTIAFTDGSCMAKYTRRSASK